MQFFWTLKPNLLSGTSRCSRLILYIFTSGLSISHFSKTSISSYFHVELLIENLGVRHVYCYWSVNIASGHSQISEQGNVRNVYTNQYIYTMCIYMSIGMNIDVCVVITHLHLYIYSKLNMSPILIRVSLIHYHMDYSSLLPCLSITSHTLGYVKHPKIHFSIFSLENSKILK